MAKNINKVIPLFFQKQYCILRLVFPVDHGILSHFSLDLF